MKSGLAIARRIRSTAAGRGDKRHLAEVVVVINGKKHWLWRALDQHGAVHDVLVHSGRDKAAPKGLAQTSRPPARDRHGQSGSYAPASSA